MWKDWLTSWKSVTTGRRQRPLFSLWFCLFIYVYGWKYINILHLLSCILPHIQQESFWNCLNITIGINDYFEWSDTVCCVNDTNVNVIYTGPKHDPDYLGRQCCSLSPVHRCQTACLRAKQYSEDLASECRKSDNMQLFQCLNLIRVRKQISLNKLIGTV
jgi:hypothetical protein